MPLKLHQRGRIWHIIGTVAGQRIRRSAETSDRELAERIRAETEARALRASIYGQQAEATFADAALLYMQSGRSKRYLTPLIKHFGKRRIDSITPGEIKMHAQRLYPTAKGSTLNRSVLKPMRAVINHAAELGLCRPIRIKRFPEQPTVRHAVDRDWIDRFRDGASQALSPNVASRLRTLALLMFSTGARLGECIALEPRHLRLDERLIVLPAELTKTGTERVLYLTDELVAELAALPPQRTHYGRGALRVFGWADGKAIVQPWRRACEAAGIVYRMRHEAGRHSFATQMIVRSGVDIRTTADMGGWRDPRVLLGYAHSEDHAAVADRVFGSTTLDTPATQTEVARRKNIRRVK